MLMIDFLLGMLIDLCFAMIGDSAPLACLSMKLNYLASGFIESLPGDGNIGEASDPGLGLLSYGGDGENGVIGSGLSFPRWLS